MGQRGRDRTVLLGFVSMKGMIIYGFSYLYAQLRRVSGGISERVLYDSALSADTAGDTACTAASPERGQNGLNCVEGAEAAKAYLVPPNCTLVKTPTMYIKSADMSGMPSTRTFKIEEIGDMPVDAASKSEVPPNISREEIEGFENRISALEKQIQGMTAKSKGKTKEAAENESTV